MDGMQGGSGRIQPGQTGPIQRPDSQTDVRGPRAPGSENLSISRTDGSPQRPGGQSPMAGLPTPRADSAQYFTMNNPSDIATQLALVQTESSQVMNETSVADAQANRDEIRTARKEVEALKGEQDQAAKDVKCADVKLAFANIFSFGIAGATDFGKKMNAERDTAMQKVATIDLQLQGLIDVPAPELSAEANEVVDAFNGVHHNFSFGDKPSETARKVLDKQHQEGRIDDSTYAGMSQLLSANKSDSNLQDWKGGEEKFFKGVVLMQALKNEGKAPTMENMPAIPDSPRTEMTGSIFNTEFTEAETNSWLAEMSQEMMMQEDMMNDMIAQLEQSPEDILAAAQDGYSINSFRHTSI